jgi:undecaprenyl-diphosphatase
LLGGFYLAVIIIFVFFERVIINYRPVLIEGVLEASYPSSTTLLFTTVMPTAAIDLSARIKSKAARGVCVLLILSVGAFCVFGRALSGVHWITDIIGGLLISAGVDLVYCSLHDIIKKS